MTSYEKPLKSAQRSIAELKDRMSDTGADLLTAILWSFYEPPLRPVRATGIPWGDEERHRLLISLWRQQWAELRSQSAFADSPISPRQLGEVPYDLQLHRSSGAQRRKEGERVVGGVPTDRPPRWAQCAASDLLEPNGLCAFLHEYGPEAGGERESFSNFATLWALGTTEAEDRCPLILMHLEELYPQADTGERLKRDLLTGRGKGWAKPLSDEEVLLGGLKADAGKSIPLDLYEVDRRVRSILRSRSKALMPILARAEKSSGPLAKLILDSLTAAPSNEVERWARADPSGLEVLLKLRPEIAALPSIWKGSDQTRIWQAVSGLQGKERRSMALGAMLASKADVDPGKLLSAWKGSDELLLDQIAAEVPPKLVSERWLHALPYGAISRWLNTNGPSVSPKAQQLIFGAAGPKELSKVRVELLLEQVEISKSQEFLASAFVAAVSSSKKPQWARVAVKTFEQLLGPKRRFSRQATTYLDELPCDWSKNASWPEKMARCLNLAFQDDKWDATETLHLTAEPFELLLAADRKAGLARRVSRASADSPELLTPGQSEILLQNIRERSDPASLFEWGEALARKLWPF
jgi:hypothetical protein